MSYPNDINDYAKIVDEEVNKWISENKNNAQKSYEDGVDEIQMKIMQRFDGTVSPTFVKQLIRHHREPFIKNGYILPI